MVRILTVFFMLLNMSVVAQFSVGGSNNFISTWNSSESGSITIPGVGQGYNYTLYWENVEDSSKFDTIFLIVSNHYTVVGLEPFKDYRIEIAGKFPRLYTNNSSVGLQLRSIQQWGAIAWTSMHAALKGTANITITAQDTPDLSLVNDLSEMFYGSTNINGSNANWNWNVSTVTTLQSTFEFSDFNEDIRSWNVENVTNMEHTFAHTSKFNVPIQTWNVSAVNNMFEMFLFAEKFDRPIGTWNVQNVTNMTSMFKNALRFNQSLGSWNLKSVGNLNFMFENSGMDCVSYSKTLMGWATHPDIPSDIWLINLSGISYSSDALSARNFLINTKGWYFMDDIFINDPLPDIGTLSGPDTLCINSTGNFIVSQNNGFWASSSPTVVAVNNTGTVNAGSTIGQSIITYTITSNGGCSGQLSQDVFVIDIPDAGTIDGPSSIEIEQIATFEASIKDGFWSVSDSNIATIDYLTGKIVGVSEGTTQVIYSLSNTCGTNTVTLPLSVNTQTINPPVSLSELTYQNLQARVFPNPTRQTITIQYQLKQTQSLTISIFDVHGKVVFQNSIRQANIGISLEQFPTGIYTVLIQTESSSETHKIVKM